jgi:Leucine-rich repeat (LRR) protein
MYYKEANVTSLSFDGNNIKTLKGFEYVSQILPNIKAISFIDNNISEFSELKYLLSLSNLIDISFKNNPIHKNNKHQVYESF